MNYTKSGKPELSLGVVGISTEKMKYTNVGKIELALGTVALVTCLYGFNEIRKEENYIKQNPEISTIMSLSKDVDKYPFLSLESKIDSMKSTPSYQANYEKNEKIIENQNKSMRPFWRFLVPFMFTYWLLKDGVSDYRRGSFERSDAREARRKRKEEEE